MIKTFYAKMAAESYDKYLAAMEAEDLKKAEYFFGEYENYQKGAESVPKDTVPDEGRSA